MNTDWMIKGSKLLSGIYISLASQKKVFPRASSLFSSASLLESYNLSGDSGSAIDRADYNAAGDLVFDKASSTAGSY